VGWGAGSAGVAGGVGSGAGVWPPPPGVPPPVPGVGSVFFFDGFFVVGAGVSTGGATGATGTPVGPLAPVAPLFSARARASRIFFTESMKSCQISAGYVPPATGWPWYSVYIGLEPSG
jgi:hypothetical protein